MLLSPLGQRIVCPLAGDVSPQCLARSIAPGAPQRNGRPTDDVPVGALELRDQILLDHRPVNAGDPGTPCRRLSGPFGRQCERIERLGMSGQILQRHRGGLTNQRLRIGERG